MENKREGDAPGGKGNDLKGLCRPPHELKKEAESSAGWECTVTCSSQATIWDTRDKKQKVARKTTRSRQRLGGGKVKPLAKRIGGGGQRKRRSPARMMTGKGEKLRTKQPGKKAMGP